MVSGLTALFCAAAQTSTPTGPCSSSAVTVNSNPSFRCGRGLLGCRTRHGHHASARQPQQLHQSVDLHGVQRPPETAPSTLLLLLRQVPPTTTTPAVATPVGQQRDGRAVAGRRSAGQRRRRRDSDRTARRRCLRRRFADDDVNVCVRVDAGAYLEHAPASSAARGRHLPGGSDADEIGTHAVTSPGAHRLRVGICAEDREV